MIFKEKSFSQRVYGYLTEESVEYMRNKKIRFIDGYKDSTGQPAPWCIIKDENGPGQKIISSHKTKKEAIKHFREIAWYGKKAAEKNK